MKEAVTLLIPFLGTSLGAAMVFLMKKEIAPQVEKALLGFAAGVMIAASVWSLLMPSIEMAGEQGKIAWLPAAIGFSLGIAFLLLLDVLIPHLHLDSEKPEGIPASLPKTTMNGSRCRICGCGDEREWHYDGGCADTFSWHCDPEFSRGSDHLHALKG